MRNTDYWTEALTIGWMIPSETDDPSIMVFILTFIKQTRFRFSSYSLFAKLYLLLKTYINTT